MSGSMVVFLDDNPTDLMIAEECLKNSRVESWKLFSDPEDLLEHMAQVGRGELEPPAAVLLDIRMPKMDGFEVLQLLRANEGLAALKIYMLSNSNAPLDQEKAQKLGADGYFVKPIDLADFEALFNGLV